MTPVEKMRQRQRAGTASKAPEPTAPTATRPTLHYSCGHERPVVEVAGNQCPACRKATAARRYARKEAKPARLDGAQGRLPDQAVYHKVYDAATETWTGTLSIPGMPLLEATAGGSYSVEKQLDRMWRQHLREIGGETALDVSGS